MILSQRVHNWLRKLAQEYLERTHPTPTTPEIYEELTREFANAYPKATRAEWHFHTQMIAALAFGDGYDIGMREKLDIEDMSAPERVADQLGPKWREELFDPEKIVPEEADTPLSLEQIQRIARRG